RLLPSVLCEELVELLVALDHSDFHAALEDGVAHLHGFHHGQGSQPGTRTLELLESHDLEGDTVGSAFPCEGLDQALVWPNLVERAVERRQRLAIPCVGIAPAPPGSGIPVLDLSLDRPRADPPGEQVRIRPGSEDPSGGASNSRVISIVGRSGFASIWVSCFASVMTRLLSVPG